MERTCSRPDLKSFLPLLSSVLATVQSPHLNSGDFPGLYMCGLLTYDMPFWSVREVLAESGAERPGLQGRCLEAGWAESKRDEGSGGRKEKLRLEPESNNNTLEKYLMMADAVRIAGGGGER